MTLTYILHVYSVTELQLDHILALTRSVQYVVVGLFKQTQRLIFGENDF